MIDLLAEARAWVAQDPDDRDRREIEQLLADPSDAARAELEDRFCGRLRFGTAGLRGPLGAGPNRMNRAVVRRTTVALARWLDAHRADARQAGVAIGCDARHRSVELADEASAVLAGDGFRVHRLADREPTPLLAFAVVHLGAAAGVMITASHNPPRDNGYKLYLSDGAQIVPPVDGEIEALIEQVGPLSAVPLGDPEGPLVERLGDGVAEAYLEAVAGSTPPGMRPATARAATAREARSLVVYTPMHGVAGRLFLDALARVGARSPRVVETQMAPDPDFPTVPSPNPEEPGALDLAFAAARSAGAELVLAHDPDGDRLAVGVPDSSVPGGWRRLGGDDVGVALGAFVLRCVNEGWRPPSAGEGRPIVAASIVSSSMLAEVAADAGVPFVATLTGCKWIVRAPDAVPGSWLAFGYEEALGYVVGEVVRDKDGIAAALAVLALAEDLRAKDLTIEGYLRALERRYGVHRTAQHAIGSREPAARMASLRARPPAEIAGRPVVRRVDLARGAVWQEGLPPLPAADVLGYWLEDGARVLVRPSGTEPKLKGYVEVVRPAGDDLDGAIAAATLALDELGAALVPLLEG